MSAMKSACGEYECPCHDELAKLKSSPDYHKSNELKRQLTIAQESLRRKNIELDALYYVWCSGGCDSGTRRYVPGDVTEEIVKAAEDNTKRLREWFENKKFRARNRK